MLFIAKNTPLLLQVALVLFAVLVSLISLRKYSNAQKIERDYLDALKAIQFLLALEEKHCREHKEKDGETKRNTMRKLVVIENNLQWNAKFASAALSSRISKIEAKQKTNNSEFLPKFLQGFLVGVVK